MNVPPQSIAADAAYKRNQETWLAVLEESLPALTDLTDEDRATLAELPMGILPSIPDAESVLWAKINLAALRMVADNPPERADAMLLCVSELSTLPGWPGILQALAEPDVIIGDEDAFLELCSAVADHTVKHAHDVIVFALAERFGDIELEFSRPWNELWTDTDIAAHLMSKMVDDPFAEDLLQHGVSVATVARFIQSAYRASQWTEIWDELAPRNAEAAAAAFALVRDPAIPGSQSLARTAFWMIDQGATRAPWLKHDEWIETLTTLQELDAADLVDALCEIAGEMRDEQLHTVECIESIADQLGVSGTETIRRLADYASAERSDTNVTMLARALTDTDKTPEQVAQHLSLTLIAARRGGGFGDATEEWRPLDDSITAIFDAAHIARESRGPGGLSITR